MPNMQRWKGTQLWKVSSMWWDSRYYLWQKAQDLQRYLWRWNYYKARNYRVRWW